MNPPSMNPRSINPQSSSSHQLTFGNFDHRIDPESAVPYEHQVRPKDVEKMIDPNVHQTSTANSPLISYQKLPSEVTSNQVYSESFLQSQVSLPVVHPRFLSCA